MTKLEGFKYHMGYNYRIELVQEQELGEMVELLKGIESDFNPPLSTRYDGDIEYSIKEYLKTNVILGETSIIAVRSEGYKLIGFTTYNREGDTCKIGVTCISHDYRGKNISNVLYDAVEIVAKKQGCNRVTRGTWATNEKQIARYIKRGFKEVGRVSREHIGSKIERVDFEKYLTD